MCAAPELDKAKPKTKEEQPAAGKNTVAAVALMETTLAHDQGSGKEAAVNQSVSSLLKDFTFFKGHTLAFIMYAGRQTCFV